MANNVAIFPTRSDTGIAVATDSITLNPWREATDKQREVALLREAFLRPILDMLARNVSARAAISNVIAHITAQDYPARYIETASKLGKKNSHPSRSTINAWLSAYQKEGRAGLLDQHTGRRRVDQGWEAAAYKLYNLPTKPSCAAVARKLREEHGFDNATDAAVTRYLRSLPAEMGEHSPARVGRKLYNNSERHFKARTTENLKPGDLYQGDGHTLDVYLAHPVTGDIWRAELTVWMDVKSRYIVGWTISNAESSIGTIRCLAATLSFHDHVPPMLYVDNGCGYKSRMMDDDAVGFYTRLGMDAIFALPGNAKAKGNVERFFRTMERDCNIWFGPAFCGEGMASDISTKFVNDCKRGLKQPPTLEQWCEHFTQWLERYHNRPHPEFKDTTPAAIWAQLERNPVHVELAELMRPRELRKVQRGAVQLHNRHYKHADLTQWNRQTVAVEYDLQNDELVTIRTEDGRFLCDAELVKKANYLPTSRVEEARIKASADAVKRLEKKADEKRARAGLTLDHSDTLDALEAIGEPVLGTHSDSALEHQPDGVDLDITTPVLKPAAPEQDVAINLDLESF